MTFRFDVYHRFQLDVRREDNAWRVYRVGHEGKRRLDPSIVIPPSVTADQLLVALPPLS